jgi:hypothetical protein
MFKSLVDFYLHGNIAQPDSERSKGLMPTKNLTPSRDEKLIEFLSEDFRDTALHLRDTDRKIEFTFQLYAGAFSLLSSIVISFLAFVIGSQNWKDEYNIYVMESILFLLIFIWLFTWWAFSYSIKGTKMKVLYINRMNFLRNEIYKHLGVKMTNSPAFLYISKFLPSESLQKVGMLDMFPLGLRYALILLPIPIFIVLYNLLRSFGVSFHWAIILVPIVVTIWIVLHTKSLWMEIVRDTQGTIEKSWNIPDNS